MKFKALTKIFGFLFSVSLAILAYFSLVVGIALAIGGNGWFAAMVYVFMGLAVVNLIGLFFVKKKTVVSIIISSFATICVIATTIYLVVVGIITESPVAFLFYWGSFVLGGLTVLFAVLHKKRGD